MSQQDERFDGIRPRTTNEKILRDWLMHAHALERVSAAEAKRIDLFLRSEVLPDVMGRLVSRLERIKSRGFDAGIETTQRWADLKDSIMGIVDEGIASIAKTNLAELKQVSKLEATWQARSIERAIPPEISLNLKLPDPVVLRQLASERPIAGHNVGEWWDKLTIDTTNRIEREVRVGLAEGQTVPQIAARIRGEAATGEGGVFNITSRHAQAISRNAAIHVSNQARQEVYKANEDVIGGEQWVATLDLRTCPKCGALDGKKFAVGEGPMPPAHPPGPSGGACRCARVPIVKSLNDLMKSIGSKRRFKDWQEGTRASMDGQVPRSLTYSEWLKELEPSQLQEALGRSRADLFTRGEVSFERMVDQSGRTLSLSQLAKREGIEL